MTDWSTVRHFTAAEWGDADKVDARLIYALDDLRHFIKLPIVIHTAFSTHGHAPDSRHYTGEAVDCHAVGMPLGEFWLAAERFAAFRGIGIYPFWSRPGLHLDVRDVPIRARWWRDLNGVYRPVEASLISLGGEGG